MPSLLGIDSGLTVTKAVIFDADGTQLAVARRRVPQSMPRARWVERDMAGLWEATAEAVREAIAQSGRPASDIKAVAATAHGDGVYLLDRERRPLGPGILSLDSRAGGVVGEWSTGSVFPEALALTGQEPHVSAPSALLAWFKRNDPDRYRRIGHVLACKDWLRFCLTGTIGTDRTEASTSFTDMSSQVYTPDALRIYGLEELFDALPPVAGSADIVGHVTAEAAALTGLAKGTPVACGLHDVTASALGIGGHEDGVISIVAGTYSINEVVSTQPHVDGRWFCRNAIDAGRWNNMSISPASAANYDWFLDTLCRKDQAEASASGGSIHTLLAEEVDAALARRSTILFHPYLFGSPFGEVASGSFVGLHGWHDRGDMLKAVLEGIVFNHKTHVEALRDGFATDEVRLTGGVSRNPTFAQMFADVLGLPVTVSTVDEAAAFGAALCAGAAVGLFASPQKGARDLAAVGRTYQPCPARSDVFAERFALYTRIAETLRQQWPAIERLAAAGGAAVIKANERRDEIANYVINLGQARIEDLVERFGVSRMTIHRHIDQLAQQGVLRKLHGMVTVQPSSIYESAFRYRISVGQAEKIALARAAMAFVEPGQVVMLDDSSTAHSVAPLLAEASPLTVVTNSMASGTLLAGVDDIDFICLGGNYHRTYDAFIGIVCEQAILRLRANLLICSASAITGTTAFIQDQQVVRIKQAMMAASTKRILLADHFKFDKVALHVLDELTAFDAVLVTDGISDIHARQLEAAGVRLHIVEVTAS